MKDFNEWGQENMNMLQRFLELCNHLLSLLHKEEIFWKQRAKTYWVRDGDTNTHFFHSIATMINTIFILNSMGLLALF